MMATKKKPILNLGNLAGEEGNAFVILGRAQKVAKDNGLDWETINAQATSHDYDYLLEIMYRYFDVKVSNAR